MSRPVITVDSKGLINDPAQKVEWLITYLISTEASQSNVHRSGLISIHDIIRKHGHDRLEMKRAIEAALESTFDGYFDTTMVDVTTREIRDRPNEFEVVIKCKVEQNKKWYDVANSLTVTNDKIALVTEIGII